MSPIPARKKVGVASFLFLLLAQHVAAQFAGVHHTPTDTPLCLSPAVSAGAAGQMTVGYTSGRIARVEFAVSPPRVTWETHAPGEVLALLELATPDATERRLVAATAVGEVLCYLGEAVEPAWRFTSSCEVDTLAEYPDVDDDGTLEVLAGGADQRVHLISGRSGRPIWTHLFESTEGTAYVMRILRTGDCDGDATPDVAVQLWSGEAAVLTGRTGTPIWRILLGGGMTDGFAAAPDLNGDGVPDLLAGGNECRVQACSGRDGAILWSGETSRPIRDLAVTPAEPARSTPDADGAPARGGNASAPGDVPGPVGGAAYVCTAGGEVARFELRPVGATATPAWTTNLGDVCRRVIVMPDVDADGVTDVAACAENGVTAVLSGRSGAVLHRWQAGDVAHAICRLDVRGAAHLAIASLDGRVTLAPAHGSAPIAPAAPPPVAGPTGTVDSAAAAAPQPDVAAVAASSSPRVIILLYHDILPEARNHYSTTVADFEAHMDMLVEEGYTCVSLDQIANWIEGKGVMPARAVCITFDGQYRGQSTYAVPILRARGLFATSYITTDWIGTSNHSDWRQIREMDAAGVLDVQNHTLNHPYLHRQEPAEVIRQVADSNQAVARHMGGKICRHHAYPSGAHNEVVRGLVRSQGFRTATTVRPGPVTRDADLMALPRYMLCTHKTRETFRGWLTGAADSGGGVN